MRERARKMQVQMKELEDKLAVKEQEYAEARNDQY
jgi:hypothetical protein